MALTATVYTFDVELSHVDRGVYESLAFKAAQHPSETDEYFITRVIAYCLEYHEGIAFSRGLAEPADPAIAIRDLTGALQAWIEIGSPDAARVHRASKAAPRVAIYTHKDAPRLVQLLSSEHIHRRDALEIYAVDRTLIAEMVTRLSRRMRFELSVIDQHLYVTIGGESLEGTLKLYSAAYD